jgi:hypothetical protein
MLADSVFLEAALIGEEQDMIVIVNAVNQDDLNIFALGALMVKLHAPVSF